MTLPLRTATDIAYVCNCTTQTIRRKIKEIKFTLPLTEDEYKIFLKQYYPKVYTLTEGTLGKGDMNKHLSIGKVVGKTKKSGNTYWYIVKFPMSDKPNDYFKQPKGYTTKEEALQVRQTLIRSREMSKAGTLEESFSYYMEKLIEKQQVRPITKRSYKTAFKTKIKEYFRDIEIKELTREILQDFVNGITGDKHTTLTVLRTALKTLYQDDRIPKDFYEQLKIRDKKSSNRRIKQAMTEEQLDNYFRVLRGHKHELVIRLMFATGIRVAEAVALDTKTDIELLGDTTGKVLINKTFCLITEGMQGIRNTTKTENGIRTVYFNDKRVVELLKENKAVIHRTTPDNLNKVFRKIGELAEIPFVVTTHHARLNYTSHSLAKGIDARILQEQLGHSNTVLINTTYGKAIGNRLAVIKEKQLYHQ